MELSHVPKRIQLRRTKGWRKPEGAIVVARPSKWGNPYRADIWSGDPEKCRARAVYCFSKDLVRALVGDLHVGWHMQRIARDLLALRGHDLACWCPLDQPCHADVLLELANS